MLINEDRLFNFIYSRFSTAMILELVSRLISWLKKLMVLWVTASISRFVSIAMVIGSS
jgi:hypothetical protein